MIYGKIFLHKRDAYSVMVLPRNSQIITPGIYCKLYNSVAIVFQQLCKYAYNVINENLLPLTIKYMHHRGVKRVSTKTISVLTEENTSNDCILTCLIVQYFYTLEISINKIEDKFNLARLLPLAILLPLPTGHGLWVEGAL